jgi:hypothetical protein
MQTQTFTQVTALVVLTLGGSATPTAGKGLPVPRIAEAAASGVAAIQTSQAVWYEKQRCSSLPSPVSTGYRLRGYAPPATSIHSSRRRIRIRVTTRRLRESASSNLGNSLIVLRTCGAVPFGASVSAAGRPT